LVDTHLVALNLSQMGQWEGQQADQKWANEPVVVVPE
jgi:hypothetical protein